MTKTFYTATLALLLVSGPSYSQTIRALRNQINQIVATKKATVGVAISGRNGQDTLSLNGNRHFPMQSVFKFHIALAVLAQVDQGKLALGQKIRIDKKDLLPHLYSPIREQYPNGATLPLAEILKHTVSASDNVGCEVLLRLIGGPKVVEAYFRKNHLNDVAIKFNEEQQQANWNLQFQNWTTPRAANATLAAFYANRKLLSKKSSAFLWQAMRDTETGEARLKGRLPKGTVVAHKTGSSGTNKAGVTAAVNDIGVVFSPNGGHYFISVFLTDSRENAAANEKIIADISKAAWDYFATSKPR